MGHLCEISHSASQGLVAMEKRPGIGSGGKTLIFQLVAVPTIFDRRMDTDLPSSLV
jgi:hypothetical protein